MKNKKIILTISILIIAGAILIITRISEPNLPKITPETIATILTAIFTGIIASAALARPIYNAVTKPTLEFADLIKRGNCYYITVKKTKGRGPAKNCRGRLTIADYDADSRWGSSRLKECDIYKTEYLRLFAIKTSVTSFLESLEREPARQKTTVTISFLEGLSKGEPATTKKGKKGEYVLLQERKFPLLQYRNKTLKIAPESENANVPKPLEIKISEVISQAKD